VLLETLEKSGQNMNIVSSDIIQFTNSLPALINNINKMVEDFSIVSLALQRHWFLKGSVGHIKKEIEKERLIQGEQKE